MYFKAGIHVLIKKEDKYLLIRRGEDDSEDPGCWDLPGGGIDFGEQPFAAAVREAKEEAGIHIEITKILALWGAAYQDKWSIETIVEAKYLSGDVKLSHEHSEFKWVNRQELREIESKGVHVKALFKHVIEII